MCHECLSNASQGYMTNTPCGEPIFVNYPVFTPRDSCIQCSGIPRPCKPWVNDLFREQLHPINLEYLDQCPCKNTGPLI
jgi:hypothetical protein